ncbi:MAG: DNA recombination protein RmuC [Patescibacteria group bacterium]|nr:DNA recombination protein RmuC [Patescibacteria group bacterium]
MQTLIVIAAAVLLALTNTILVLVLIRRKTEKLPAEGQGSDGLKLLLEQVNELNRTVDRKVGDLTRTVDSKIDQSARHMQDSMRTQLSESSRLIRDITSEIVQVKKIGEQSLSVQNQLRELEDILKNPKHRGILGEYYLETLLKNVLAPGQYQMQYPFKNGEIVDAAVFVKDKVIPVDSKFSLENYNKMADARDPAEKERLEKAFVSDLKLRIQETSKYVRPDEKTMDFAFMFIPHEAIYYDLLVNKIGSSADDTDNLIQRAASKYKVIIVSPTSFLAYLQTVLQGLKAMQIEETAKDIIKHVGQLGAHLKKYEEYHEKIGVSLSTVVNHYNNSSKEFKKVDKDVLRITGETPGLEPTLIDRPEGDE